MPTRRGAGVLVGAALCWAVGRLLGIEELYIVAVAAAGLVAGAAAVVGLGGGRVSVRRRLPTHRTHPGRTVEVAVDLRNDGRVPSGTLLVEDRRPYVLRPPNSSGDARFAVPPIRPGGARTVSYPVTAAARGRWSIGPLRLVMRDPFGVIERTRRYASVSELLVYPRVEPLPTGARIGSHLGSGSSNQRRLLGAGTEFHTIREYRTGDDLRRVHWPSTARQQRLMVRQNEQALATRATVLLDTRAEAHRGHGAHGSFEVAVTAAASVLAHLDEQRYETALLTTEPSKAAPRPQSLIGHLERLAGVEPGRHQTLQSTLAGLRTVDGVLVAVLAGGSRAPADDPEVRALLVAGRRFAAKAALVVDDDPASPLAALLLATGWRAATTADGLAAAWRGIVTQSRQRAPA